VLIPFRLKRHSRCWRSRQADQSRRSTLQKIDACISILRNRVAEAKAHTMVVASSAHFPRSAGSTKVASSSSSDTSMHCMGSEHCLLLPWCELSFCYSVPEDCNACVDFLPGTVSALICPTAPPTSTVAYQSERYEYDSVLSRNVEILFQNLRIVMPKARV